MISWPDINGLNDCRRGAERKQFLLAGLADVRRKLLADGCRRIAFQDGCSRMLKGGSFDEPRDSGGRHAQEFFRVNGQRLDVVCFWTRACAFSAAVERRPEKDLLFPCERFSVFA